MTALLSIGEPLHSFTIYSYKMVSCPLSRLIATAFITILVGCSPTTPSDTFAEYLTRVARVLDVDIPQSEFEFPPLPRKRDLAISIPSLSLGLLDSYQLRQCGLFQLIAEKNSVLGKVADEFRNYDYQIALLKGISVCLDSDRLEGPLEEALAEIYASKSKQLPWQQWNLVYASEAMQSQMRHKGWIEQNIDTQVKRISVHLGELSQLLDSRNSAIKVVSLQEMLEKEAILGDLNYSLARSAFQLDLITERLKEYDHKVICGQQRDKTRFKRLNNVFEQQYVGHIQPYLAQLDRYYQYLDPSLTIFDLSSPKHEYQFPIRNNHQQFRHSIKRHVSYWETLFKRCGRTLG